MGLKEPPIPPNDEQRIRVLKGYTLTEEVHQVTMQGLVELAAQLCNVSVASIGFVDRLSVNFMAAVGRGAGVNPREKCLCSYVILADEPLIIHDLKNSSYWQHDHSDPEPTIHSYMGFPITVEGERIGAFAVTTAEKCNFSAAQIKALKSTCSQLERYLALLGRVNRVSQLNRQLRSSQYRYVSFQQGTCVTEIDLDGRISFVNKKFQNLFGYTLPEIMGRHHSVLVAYNRRNSPEYVQFWEKLEDGKFHSGEFERITKDKRTIWIRASYTAVKDFSGKVLRYVEYAYDITAEKQLTLSTLHHNKTLDEHLVVAEIDKNFRFTSANENLCALLDYSYEELIGRGILELTPQNRIQDQLSLWSEASSAQALDCTFPLLNRAGEVMWIEGRLVAPRSEMAFSRKYMLIGFNRTQSRTYSLLNNQTLEGLRTSSAFVEFDSNGTIVQVNENFLDLFEYNRHEVIGYHHSIFLSREEWNSKKSEDFWQELCTGTKQVGHYKRFTKFGEELWIRGAYCPVRDENSQVVKVVMFTFDTTEDRRENNKLALENQHLRFVNINLVDSHARYKALGDVMPLGLLTTDVEGKITLVNERLCEITLSPEEDLLTKEITTIVHPADQQRVFTEWDSAVGDALDYKSTHRLLRKNGEVLWVNVQASPVFDKGFFIGYVATIEDFSETKLAKERLNLATSAANIGIWEWGLKDDQLIWDQSMLSIYGIERQDFSGTYQFWTETLVPTDKEHFERELRTALNKGGSFRTRYRIARPDGEVRVIQATGIVQTNHLDDPIRVLGTNLDITEQSFRESEMRVMRKAAESAAQAKSDFLANMSHEIRTPLASIIGYAEAASEQDVSEEKRIKALGSIMMNGEHLLRVINDVLDLSKINAGALQIESTEFAPAKLIQTLGAMVTPKLQEKGLDFSIEVTSPLPRTVQGDNLRLSQVLINLVSNAIKFTDQGGVTVKISCSSEGQKLRFEVIDTGIGMKKATLSKLFQPFTQADVSTTREFGGTGLGLSISKELVEGMGGTISVHSQEGVGSTFSFFVETGELSKDPDAWMKPEEALSISNQIVPTKSLAQRLASLTGRILVADDAPEIRHLLEFTLHGTNLDLSFVVNGQQALDKAIDESFDLIMLDMQMPVMDGYTAARKLRDHGLEVPIIAFTANALTQHIERSKSAGCSGYLVKPFTKAALAEVLEKNLGKDSQIEQLTPSVEPTELEILVSEAFEEDPNMLDLVYKFIELLAERVQLVKTLYADKKSDELSELLHTMSGSANMYGYPLLQEVLREISSAHKDEDDMKFNHCTLRLHSLFDSIVRGLVVMECNPNPQNNIDS